MEVNAASLEQTTDEMEEDEEEDEDEEERGGEGGRRKEDDSAEVNHTATHRGSGTNDHEDAQPYFLERRRLV